MKDIPIPYWKDRRKFSRSEAVLDYLYNCDNDGKIDISERALARRWGWDRRIVSKFVREEVVPTDVPKLRHLTYFNSIISEIKRTKIAPICVPPKRKKKETLEERRKIFINELAEFLPKYGRDMINDFYRYWSEPDSKDGKKMRFEMNDTWLLAGRLETWHRRNQK
jgi:hypothetical protein